MTEQGPLSGADHPLQPIKLGLSLLGLLFLGASFLPLHGFDLYAYWTVEPFQPYARTHDQVNTAGSFFYAPPLALLMAPLSALPWEAIVIGWLAIQMASLWYIGRSWALALIVFPPVWLDIVYGNINVLLAAMIVAGFRVPSAWTFGLLTKVTPGVGLIWFAARRDWRALAQVAATTAVIVGVSVVIQGPAQWLEWVSVLARANDATVPPDALAIPLLPRLAAAAGLVAWAAVTDRRWLIPIGVTLAMPLLWPIALAPLIACWALIPPASAARIRDAITGWTLRRSAVRAPSTARTTKPPPR